LGCDRRRMPPGQLGPKVALPGAEHLQLTKPRECFVLRLNDNVDEGQNFKDNEKRSRGPTRAERAEDGCTSESAARSTMSTVSGVPFKT
jgi:hypothetical protein